jgi:toxin-antitoxin system PIN domain toxin
MISIDTNILLPAVERSNPNHQPAAAFLTELQNRDDVAISEFALLELYILLRTAAVIPKPLSANQAVDVCEAFRRHPRWQLLGFPPASRDFHDDYWPRLRAKSFPRRRAIDIRMGLSLVRQGVKAFATVNTRDFQRLGFEKVWNPLSG